MNLPVESLDEREQLLLLAAYFHGTPPNGSVRANCGRVLGQALVWAGLWNDTVRRQALFGADVGDTTVVESWYDTLISMMKRTPASDALVFGAGNLGSPDGDRPAWPAFTSCGLTEKGWAMAEQLLSERPDLVAKPQDFFVGL